MSRAQTPCYGAKGSIEADILEIMQWTDAADAGGGGRIWLCTHVVVGVSLRAMRYTTQVMLGVSLRVMWDTTLVYIM